MNKLIRRSFSWIPLLSFNRSSRDAWVAAQAAKVPACSLVIDVGAGSCPYRSLFSHCDYRSQDFKQLADGQLRSHEKYAEVNYVSDICNLPVADSTFDVVLCTEVLEHVPEPIRAVREFSRVLKPGGKLYLTAPLGSGLHQEPYHFYGGFTPHWYRRTLRATGFDEVTIESNGGSYMHFAQWSVWFARNSAFWRIPAPWYICLAFLPVWLLCVPMLGFLFLACRGLDRYDHERQFTVGYHVAARKATVGAPSAAARDRSA